MIDWIRRKKLRKSASLHFGADDIIINGYRLNAVSVIPQYVKKKQELDFYLDTGYDIYLLRLKNIEKNTITICPATKICPIVYLICEVSYTNQTLFDILEIILEQLKEVRIPNIINPKQEIILIFSI